MPPYGESVLRNGAPFSVPRTGTRPRVPNSLESFHHAAEQQAAILSMSDSFLILGALTVFMMVLVIAGGMLVMAGWPSIGGLLFLVPPFHMYRQLKGAYQLGRFGTWWRTTLLVTFSFIAAALFFVVVAAVGMT